MKAFEKSIREKKEILAISGRFDQALASKSRGTMRFRDEGDDLVVELDRTAATTPAGREVAETMKAVPVVTRPVFDQDASEFVEDAGAATY